MADQTSQRTELGVRRAITIPQAAHLYDMTRNTMRKILRDADVLIEIGRIHRVRWDDLLRVMEGDLARPSASLPESTPATISDIDRAAFTRASARQRRD